MPTLKKLELYNGEVVAELKIKMWRGREVQKYVVSDKGTEVEDLLRVTDVTGALPKDWMAPWVAKINSDYLRDYIGESLTVELIEESKKQYNIMREAAADIGTAVHAWAENYIKTGERALPNDEKTLNGITAFLKWVDEHKVQFISSERMVYDRDFQYIGTMDAEAEVDGQICVVDFKTSKALYPEYHLQTAAYQAAAEAEGSKYTGDRWIARFDKETGEFECVQRGKLDKDINVFTNMLDVKRWLNNIKV